MTEYVVWAVLHHCRDMEKYRADQSAMAWLPVFPRPRGETSVGIMGLGQLGSHAAATLRDLGFPVLGWSRTPKGIAGVATHWGKEGLGGFLTRTWILVCLLPLTPETRGILNRRTFAALPRGAYLINVARGAHLAKEDLLEALGSGQLSGACLDVFETEPLPAGHPFWSHPRIMVTPHVSSLTDPQAVAVQILENYCRLRRGEPLVHVVDRQRGY
jgi:glyoxylate/hydroxypyruvate reductase A